LNDNSGADRTKASCNRSWPFYAVLLVEFSFLQLHYKSISLIIYSRTTLVEVHAVAVNYETNMLSGKVRAKGSFFAFEVDLGDVKHGGKMLSGQNI
jgi:hypothetical protein